MSWSLAHLKSARERFHSYKTLTKKRRLMFAMVYLMARIERQRVVK